MLLFTIGFTQKTAEAFFGALKTSGAQRVIDVRLHNVSQLAGFAKRSDLEFFLREICGISYLHLPEMAPAQNMLDAYRKHQITWPAYEQAFLQLMRKREIRQRIDPALLAQGCLLCSENQPHHCHRRLVAEYLRTSWGDVEIRHLT
jgi:uncharacterized protein (DUF488 family)